VSAVAPWRVVIAGGGIAGVEALLGLSSLGERRLQLAVVTPENRFTVRPYAVGEPFGGPPSPSLPMADVAREAGARFIRDRVTGVRPADMAVDLEGGGTLAYDALVLAVGACAREAHPSVVTFGGPYAVPAVRQLVADLTHGHAASVAFVVPPGTSWPLPIYELALMTRGRAQRRRVLLVTPEAAPLALFGPDPSLAVGELLARVGIELHTGARAEIAADGRALRTAPSEPWMPVDRIVAAPVLEGPRLPGVPHDDDGYIPVDEYCRVRGLEHVYAAGDGTDGPVKQGGLAAQQADAAVGHLVAEAGGTLPPQPFRPVLRGRLLTGGLDRFLRHDPEAGDSVLAEPLWEPAAKVVGHYLAPWLAYRHPELGRQRIPPAGAGAARGIDLALEPYGPLPRGQRP
jgi:sulfide:quinone oxidoreductase